MRVWDEFLTESDRDVYAASGYGTNLPFGRRPVLLIIDVTYAFTGDKDEPILDSIVKWHRSCGDRAWVAIPHISRLLEAARSKNLPVFYSTGFDARPGGLGKGLWRNSRADEAPPTDAGPQEIIGELAPEARDIVIQKTGPSAFFGTALATYLTSLGADSLIVCGTSTSGCVRATAVDAFSSSLLVTVAEEACFDRYQSSHALALFDMNAKYADVRATSEVVDYIEALPFDLYGDHAGKEASIR
jgi:maleamate amidohydrolase